MIIDFFVKIEKMPSKKPSTVVLTPEAQAIKDRIAGAFSLKGIFSAGMVWFNLLEMDTMIDIVSTAKKNLPLKPIIQKVVSSETRKIENTSPAMSDAMHIIKLFSPDGNIDINILSREDKEALAEIQKLIGPKVDDPLEFKLDFIKSIADDLKPEDHAPFIKALNIIEEQIRERSRSKKKIR
ncbi:MAG: hypothetical protein JXA04_01390 [Gammaproteobacteria bacterium]|nr:hypothetical protein [Gammaproteobacteria bacterium]